MRLQEQVFYVRNFFEKVRKKYAQRQEKYCIPYDIAKLRVVYAVFRNGEDVVIYKTERNKTRVAFQVVRVKTEICRVSSSEDHHVQHYRSIKHEKNREDILFANQAFFTVTEVFACTFAIHSFTVSSSGNVRSFKGYSLPSISDLPLPRG